MQPLALFLLLVPLLFFLLIFLGQRKLLHRLADYLESSGWVRLLSVLSHIGIVFAVIVFALDWPVRQETLKAFREEAEDRKAGAEGRAWSLVYQAKGSSGDGGRRYALEYLNKKKSNLAGLPLTNAWLVAVAIPGAILRGANLTGANLSRANLLEASLISADLREANLGGANLREANLGGANLRGAKDLTQEQINHAFYCKQLTPPKLPAELKPPPGRECDNRGMPIKK
jgi:hypothetical protein